MKKPLSATGEGASFHGRPIKASAIWNDAPCTNLIESQGPSAILPKHPAALGFMFSTSQEYSLIPVVSMY